MFYDIREFESHSFRHRALFLKGSRAVGVLNPSFDPTQSAAIGAHNFLQTFNFDGRLQRKLIESKTQSGH